MGVNTPPQQPMQRSGFPGPKANDGLKGRMRTKGKDRKSGGKGQRPDRDRPEKEGAGVKEWEGSIATPDSVQKRKRDGASWQDLERFENIEKLREKGREDIEDEQRALKRTREETEDREGEDDLGDGSSVFSLFYAAKQDRLAKKAVEFDGRIATD